MFRSPRRNSASPSPAATSSRERRRPSQGSPSVSPPPPSASSLLAQPDESAFTRSASYRERRGSRSSHEGRMQRASSVVAATSGLCSIENMTLSQACAIRKSWKHINTKGLVQVVSRCFHKVESRCPAVAAAFSSATFLSTSPATTRSVSEHTKFLLTLFDDLIEGSGTTGSNGEILVIQQLRDYGAKHAHLRESCNLRAEAWEVFGEVLVESFVKLDGVKQNKEASRGWRLLIATVTDRLRCGFEQEVRMHKRRSSLNDSAQADTATACASAIRSRPRSRSGEEGYLRRGGP